MVSKLFILFLLLLVLFFFLTKNREEGLTSNQRWERLVDRAEDVQLDPSMVGSKAASKSCNMFNCFDVYRCGVVGRGGLKVFIHPPTVWTKPSGDEVAPLTTEFYEMLEAVHSSPYYTEDPSEACLFIPSIDLLNLQEQVLHNGYVLLTLTGALYVVNGPCLTYCIFTQQISITATVLLLKYSVIYEQYN